MEKFIGIIRGRKNGVLFAKDNKKFEEEILDFMSILKDRTQLECFNCGGKPTW